MSLRSFHIETRTVGPSDNPANQITVRGVNLNDLLRLVTDHGPAMVAIYKRVTEARGGAEYFTEAIVRDMLMAAIREFPELVSGVIAYAADEPDMIEVAGRLPLSMQLEALDAIVALTLMSEAELKKLQEMVLKTISEVATALKRLNTPIGKVASDLGFGKSAAA